MALEQRKTTRWTARVGTWIRAAVWFVADILSSFLDLKEGDSSEEKKAKTISRALQRAVYEGADYGLVAVSILIVSSMKALGFSFTGAFAALWVFDFVVAGAFVAFYEKTGKDLSLGEDFRRAVDTIHGKSKLAGYLAMSLVMAQAIYWSGPEQIVIFFRKEIGTVSRVVTALAGLTAIQALIWTVLYGFGYHLVTGQF